MVTEAQAAVMAQQILALKAELTASNTLLQLIITKLVQNSSDWRCEFETMFSIAKAMGRDAPADTSAEKLSAEVLASMERQLTLVSTRVSPPLRPRAALEPL